MAASKNCEGWSRRNCLQLGVGLFAGGGLTNLWRLTAQAALTGRKPARCILVWLDGGPTHFETFDPKPEAPAEIRGDLSPIATRTAGVYFSQHLERLAAISDKLAVVRSVCHDQGNHGAGNHYMMTGAPPRIPVGCGAFVSFHPSLGSVAAKELGAPAGLPAYFSIPVMSRSGGPNFLGAKYAPFLVADDPNSAGFRVRDVAIPAGLTEDRFLGRRDLRSTVDRLQRYADEQVADPALAVDEYYRQSYDLMTSPQAQQAFDIHSEPESTRELYGRTSFGQRCLLARRLVEAGVPFITLYDGGWDHHGDIFAACGRQLPVLDQGIAALVTDLEQRGLLEDTLVLCLGEFGRTPKITTLPGSTPGRDHWSSAMSILFAGAGTPGGIVVGETDRNGHSPASKRYSPEEFASTVYLKLGIDPATVFYLPNGRPVPLVSNPRPIPELMG